MLKLTPLLAFKPTVMEEAVSHCLATAWNQSEFGKLLGQDVRSQRIRQACDKFVPYAAFIRFVLKESPPTFFQMFPTLNEEEWIRGMEEVPFAAGVGCGSRSL